MPVFGGWNKRNDPPGLKWCPHCRSLVAHADFGRNRSGFGGLGAYCNACKAAKQRARREVARGRQEVDQATADRFMSQLDKDGPGGCWLWLGHKTADGYGTYEVNGMGTSAHKAALLIAKVEVPAGYYVDHLCRVRSCCNPEHLRPVPRRVSALENNHSPHALNARKTHCTPRNHPLSGDNLHYQLLGGELRRVCLACMRLRRPGCTWQPNTPETARVVVPRARPSGEEKLAR